MAKRLKQSNIFDAFSQSSKRHKKSEEMSHEDVTSVGCHDSAMVASDIEQEGTQNETGLTDEYQESQTVLESQDHLQSDVCLSSCCTGMKPYQPTNKVIISSMAHSKRNFVEHWYTRYHWLTICTTRKKVFCFYCRYVESQGMMTFSSKAESTFSKVGFNNWKKALEKFENHNNCHAHGEAILKWQMLQTTPISNHLNSQVKKDQEERRQALLKQLHCLRFLLRQGLAIRGHEEIEGNLNQLLIMWSAYDSGLRKWFKDKKYMSPVIVNELISCMGLSVLRSLLRSIKECSPAWYSIIADEATDVSNREQLNLSIRWVNNNYDISEDSVGLYCLPNTKSETLYTVITDILQRCTLPLTLCRGQAFDGAANMQGVRNGLATQIRNKVPAAISVHCLAHCLNLCLQDAGRKLTFLRDALDTVREIAQLIKFSPKRAHLFSKNLADKEEVVGVTIKVLCITRWTARTGAIGAVITDYEVLMDTLDEIHQTTHDEYGLKAAGILASLEKFSTLFGLKLGYLIFGASETLSKSLQGKDLTIQEALSAVNLAKAFYRRQRTSEAFSLFYDGIVDLAEKLKINGPQLPRNRRVPKRFDDGSQPHQYKTPRDYFRHQYFEACDLLHQELESRFQQHQSLKQVLSLENILLKAANGDDYQEDFESAKLSCYKDDINFFNLEKQLPLLTDMVKQALPCVKQVTTIRTICEAMNTQSVFKSMLPEVHSILRLYLTMPITSATSERSFSTLKRVLTFLRSSMSEQRLNNCMLLHIHKELTDSLNLTEIAKEFITANSDRLKYFGTL